ncbi:MAG: ribonuclease P protein component [Clostridia bacterium]|nr:ribonuclease P protein component [Clostridia bacterium]MDD4375309.1 ribonuclease P protein component [Clostridia bacterium]
MIFTKSLKGSYYFKRLLRKGKYSSSANITVYVLDNKRNKVNNYLGICVSKKHGNSVVRNKLKRWAKESHKEVETRLSKGKQIIVLYKKNINIDKINFNTIIKELKQNYLNLGIMNNVENNEKN